MKIVVKSRIAILSLIVVVYMISFITLGGVVGDDSSAYITKPEFDSLKNSIDMQMGMYNANADAKIDQAIATYLANYDIGSGKKVLDNKQTRIIIDKKSDLPEIKEDDYNEDKHYFAKDTGEEYAPRKFIDGTFEWKVVDPIGNIYTDKAGADKNKVPVVNDTGKYEIKRVTLEERVKVDTTLKTVEEIKKYDETKNDDVNYELMTENAMAKVMAKAFGVSYTESDNKIKKTLALAFGFDYSEDKSLAQMNYDRCYPIGFTIVSSNEPNVPNGIQATWTKEDAGYYLCQANTEHKDGDVLTEPQLQNISGSFYIEDGAYVYADGILFKTSETVYEDPDMANTGPSTVKFDASKKFPIYKNGLTNADRLRPVTIYKSMWKRTK